MNRGAALWSILIAATLAAPGRAPLGAGIAPGGVPTGTSLTGGLLVADPQLRDPGFHKAVIFMVSHDSHGAFGLIVNRPVVSTKLSALLDEFGADPEDIEGEVKVHYGGPVEPSRGFVLHSIEPELSASIRVNDRFGVSSHVEVLRAMAGRGGPKRALLALGYAGWGPGQLERELERGGWVVAPAEDAILFDERYATKWERAYASRYFSM